MGVRTVSLVRTLNHSILFYRSDKYRSMIFYLLNNLHLFLCGRLNVILGLISRYKALSEEEMFGMMNLLDPVLRTANSGTLRLLRVWNGEIQNMKNRKFCDNAVD